MTRYATTHPVTGATENVESVTRDGICWITWGQDASGTWVQLGASKATDYAKAVKAAKSTGPYFKAFEATTAIDSRA